VARQIDGDAAIPGGHLRHLEDPARLVHRVWMHKGDNRAALAHRLVIKRSVDGLGHALPTSDWAIGSAPPALAQRLKCNCIGIRRSGAGPEAVRRNRSRLPGADAVLAIKAYFHYFDEPFRSRFEQWLGASESAASLS